MNVVPQHEFCPPLDSSLVAALVADLELDAGNSQIEGLRATLRELSAQAEVSQLSEISGLQVASPTSTSTSSSFGVRDDYTTTPSSLTPSTSLSSQDAFSSPFGFLRAALPHVPNETFRSALKDADMEELDLWEVVAGILTAETIREMEERGLDEDDSRNTPPAEWQIVGEKKGKRRNKRGNTITLGDVRQQQQIRPVPRKSLSASPDPWTQLSSLSSHLATLLPPHQPSFFQSHFHSPEHPTPGIALRACLASICKARTQLPPEEHTDTLFILLDILLPEYPTLDQEEHNQLISDIELALQATSGNGDGSLNIVKLLRDLDTDSTDRLEMGVYHTSPPALKSKPRQNTLPSGPPPIPPPPQPLFKPEPPESPSPSPKNQNPFGWQSVPIRQIPRKGPDPLAQHIPAYNRNGVKGKGAGNTFGQGGKGDVGELGDHGERIRESMRKRHELLRSAAWMWQRGNSGNRGGEVALYFADRVRCFLSPFLRGCVYLMMMVVPFRRGNSRRPRRKRRWMLRGLW